MVYRLIIHTNNLQLQSYINNIRMFSKKDVLDKLDWLVYSQGIPRHEVLVKIESGDECENVKGDLFYVWNR